MAIAERRCRSMETIRSYRYIILNITYLGEASPASHCSNRSVIRVHSLQKILYAADGAGIGGDIAGQGADRLAEFAALHDLQHALHRRGLQKRALAHEEIVLREQPDEVEPELPRRRLDAEGRVRHSARHIGGDRRMREFDVLRPVD